MIGRPAGTETVTLSGQQIPPHVHPLVASSSTGTLSKPTTASVPANQSNASVQVSRPIGPAFACFTAWMVLCDCALRFFGYETGKQSIAAIGRELDEKVPASVAE